MLSFLLWAGRYFSAMQIVRKASLALISGVIFSSCGNGTVETVQLTSNVRASEKDASALYNAAVDAQTKGKLKKARGTYRRIVERHPLCPTAPESAYRWGKLLEQNGEPLEAFNAYDAILTRYPASPHYAEAMARQEIIAHQAAEGHITNSFVGIKSRIDLDKTADMLRKVRQNAPRALSAEKAQFTVGQIYQTRGRGAGGKLKAVAAYRELTRDFPDSQYAAEAQYRIGEMLLAEAKEGNQDRANLDRAKKAFEDVLIRYPKTPQAKKAKAQVAKLSSGEIERSFEIAEFYRKKGQIASALFYYRDTVNSSKPGPLRSQAESWIRQLSSSAGQ